MVRTLARCCGLLAALGAGACGGGPGASSDAGTDAGAADAGGRDAAPADGGGVDAGPAGCVPEDGAPTFAGLASAEPAGVDAVSLGWEAASSATTPPELIAYRVFVSEAPGAQDFDAPAAVATGVTRFRLEGLPAAETRYVVVRAQDEDGREDCNTVELAATPAPLEACVDFDAQIRPLLLGRCVSCHSGRTPARGFRIDSWADVLAGGASGPPIVACRPEWSLLFVKLTEDAPPRGGRMPLGGPYLDAAQIDLVRRFIAQGAAAACPIDAARCADDSAPAFGGIAEVELVDASSARLCWARAVDDVTPPEALVYDVFVGDGGGAPERALPDLSSAPGDECVTVGGLVPDARSCFVVRARDGAGNRDDNRVERCLDVPAVACVDYVGFVRPLLEARCVECHGDDRAIRGVELDSPDDIRASGTVVACDVATSSLYEKLLPDPPDGVRMPADGPPFLSDAQIAALALWIEGGARERCDDPDPCL